MSIDLGAQSADDAVRGRAPEGISTHDMPGGWKVLVAKCGERSRTWYYAVGSDPRYIRSLEIGAQRWKAHYDGR